MLCRIRDVFENYKIIIITLNFKKNKSGTTKAGIV